MNRDLEGFYKEFSGKSKHIKDVQSSLLFLEKEFDFDREEAIQLFNIMRKIIVDKYEVPKKKRELKKFINYADNVSELMVDSFFFGMFLSQSKDWSNPVKDSS